MTGRERHFQVKRVSVGDDLQVGAGVYFIKQGGGDFENVHVLGAADAGKADFGHVAAPAQAHCGANASGRVF
jgi:hypothetical protein